MAAGFQGSGGHGVPSDLSSFVVQDRHNRHFPGTSDADFFCARSVIAMAPVPLIPGLVPLPGRCGGVYFSPFGEISGHRRDIP